MIKYEQKPTLRVPKELKGLLDNMKLHPRERYEDVIKRLAEQVKTTYQEIVKEEKEVDENGTNN
jgi:hypothetical protein